MTIGATVSVTELEERDEPLATRREARRRPRDPRAGDGRRQPLRRRPGSDAPRGDLQAPLIALGARVRSAGDGRRAHRAGRGLPRRRRRRAASCSTSPTTRPTARPATPPSGGRTPTTTRSSPSAASEDGDELRVAATGAGPHAVGSRPAEQSGERGSDAAERRRPARRRARLGLVPQTSPAHARRRERSPTSLRRPPDETDRQRRRARDREPRAHPAAPRPARGARDHEPEGRLPAGRLRRLHGARRRRAAPLVPAAASPRSTARRSRRVEGIGTPEHLGADPGRLPRPLRHRSAASARPASCSRRTRYIERGRRRRPRRRSRRRSPATSAAAPAT